MGKEELSSPRNLRQFIEYQKDSIVSKTLVKGEKGSITLFSFDEDQGLSKHSVPSDAFVYLIEGEGEFNIGDKVFLLTEGESIIMPAGVSHSVKARKRFKMLLVIVS